MLQWLVASQQEGHGFKSSPDHSVWSLHVPPAWVLSGCCRFLPPSKDTQLIGNFICLAELPTCARCLTPSP